MNPTTSISLAQFKSAAKRFRDHQAEKGLRVTHQKSLSELAKILFGRPYEEIQKTRFSSEPPNTVRLLGYQGAFHVAVQGELAPQELFVKGDSWSASALRNAHTSYAKGEANRLGIFVRATGLPYWLPEGEATEEAVVALARALGLLEEDSLILELIGTNQLILNGKHTPKPAPMNEWPVPEVGSHDPAHWLAQVVWTPEVDGVPVAFTAGDLVDAERLPGKALIQKGGVEWIISFKPVPRRPNPEGIGLTLITAGLTW